MASDANPRRSLALRRDDHAHQRALTSVEVWFFSRIKHQSRTALTAILRILAPMVRVFPNYRKIKNKKIITIDGCTTECSKGVFDKIGIEVDIHIKLREYGIRKNGPINDYDIKRLMEEVEKEAISGGHLNK